MKAVIRYTKTHILILCPLGHLLEAHKNNDQPFSLKATGRRRELMPRMLYLEACERQQERIK